MQTTRDDEHMDSTKNRSFKYSWSEIRIALGITAFGAAAIIVALIGMPLLSIGFIGLAIAQFRAMDNKKQAVIISRIADVWLAVFFGYYARSGAAWNALASVGHALRSVQGLWVPAYLANMPLTLYYASHAFLHTLADRNGAYIVTFMALAVHFALSMIGI